MADDLKEALEKLKGELPVARTGLTEAEKDELIQRIGPRTARSIVKAKADFPLRRIAFLFSSIDTQAVVDLLANDVTHALSRALPAASKAGASRAKP